MLLSYSTSLVQCRLWSLKEKGDGGSEATRLEADKWETEAMEFSCHATANFPAEEVRGWMEGRKEGIR